jgi:hypothetical protein
MNKAIDLLKLTSAKEFKLILTDIKTYHETGTFMPAPDNLLKQIMLLIE